MATIDDFSSIIDLQEIQQYILVKSDGTIAATQSEKPESFARLVLRCGRNSDKLGLPRFNHLSFTMESGDVFFIFPVGNYYLGVIKERNIPNSTLVKIVETFIKNFQREQS